MEVYFISFRELWYVWNASCSIFYIFLPTIAHKIYSSRNELLLFATFHIQVTSLAAYSALLFPVIPQWQFSQIKYTVMLWFLRYILNGLVWEVEIRAESLKNSLGVKIIAARKSQNVISDILEVIEFVLLSVNK